MHTHVHMRLLHNWLILVASWFIQVLDLAKEKCASSYYVTNWKFEMASCTIHEGKNTKLDHKSKCQRKCVCYAPFF